MAPVSNTLSRSSSTAARPPRRPPAAKLNAARQKPSTAAAKEQAANPAVQLLVGAATEALRLVSGAQRSTAAAPPPPANATRVPRRGDVQSVLRALRDDYRRAYFVTGILTDGIYDADCYFADPTVKFRGRELWKRNLQLLVPFLEDPKIVLKSLRQAAPADAGAGRGAVLYAEWLLTAGLRLPWRPYVVVNGSTEYTLAWPDNNRVVSHVEGWDIGGGEALAQVLLPGGERRKRAGAQ